MSEPARARLAAPGFAARRLNSYPLILTHMFRILLLLLVTLLAAVATTRAQVITAGPDSARVNSSAPTKRQRSAADSAARTERLFGLRLTRPGKAALLALAPGGGQIYNKRYWKLPLVYGLLGGLAYGILFEQVRYKEYGDAIDYIAGHPIPAGKRPSDVLNDNYPRARRELSVSNINTGIIYYRRYRDQFILFALGGYGLQILDALVDAHLHDFDVSDDLTLHWEPALLPMPGQLPGFGATVALHYK